MTDPKSFSGPVGAPQPPPQEDGNWTDSLVNFLSCTACRNNVAAKATEGKAEDAAERRGFQRPEADLAMDSLPTPDQSRVLPRGVTLLGENGLASTALTPEGGASRAASPPPVEVVEEPTSPLHAFDPTAFPERDAWMARMIPSMAGLVISSTAENPLAPVRGGGAGAGLVGNESPVMVDPPSSPTTTRNKHVQRLCRALGGGIHVIKHGRRNKPQERHLYLSDNLTQLQWNSKKKKAGMESLTVAGLISIDTGASHQDFARTIKTMTPEQQHLCMAIVFAQRSLAIQCKTVEDWETLRSALRHLAKMDAIEEQQEAFANPLHTTIAAAKAGTDAFSIYVKTQWDASDKNQNGALDHGELMSMLKRINVAGYSKSKVTELLKAHDRNGNGTIEFDEFAAVLGALEHRAEVDALIESITGMPCKRLTKEQFKKFLQTEQDAVVDDDVLQQMVDFMEQRPGAVDVTARGLARYLNAPDNSVVRVGQDPHHRGVVFNMDDPLPFYYINTSRDTYLTGLGIGHPSSAERYSSVLLSGCRCVQVRVVDNHHEAHGEPQVGFNNKPTTLKVPLRDVLTAIRNAAFAVNKYPVIISWEICCHATAQRKLANMVTEILGPWLCPALKPTAKQLPSPEQLKERILNHGRKHCVCKFDEIGDVKGKPCPWHFSDIDDVAMEETEIDKHWGDMIHLEKRPFRTDIRFQTEGDRQPVMQCSSLSSHRILKLTPKENKTEGITPNRANLLRLHSRCLSAAFVTVEGKHKINDPSTKSDECMVSWAAGCQLVATNYLINDVPTWLNKAWFAQSTAHGSGYAHKPEYLINLSASGVLQGQRRKSVTELQAPATTARLVLEVLSGQRLPKPNRETRGEVIDPYVQVAMHGCEIDYMQSHTRVIQDNGFNPIWAEAFLFDLEEMEMAVLRLTVWDKDLITADDFIGQFTCKVSALREGYRHVPLSDEGGRLIDASLLVKVKFVDPKDPTYGIPST